jgi:hypothetical protein
MKAVDFETGMPISNAVINVTFIEREDPWGNGVGKVDRQKKPVDKNGLATFSGDSVGNGCGGSVDADGYYQSTKGMTYSRKNIALNRWEPWSPTIKVKMRKIKNPTPMIFHRMLRNKVPIKNGHIGFDLEATDWVKPYGQGLISDLVFTLTTVTEPKQGLEYSLTFTNPMDGVQEYTPPQDMRSSYIFPYEAPTNGYSASLNKYRLLYYPVIPNYPANNLKDNINYIFRVRTVVDENGQIIEANYGRIQGEVVLSDTPLIDMQYWFNPDPHSRSLESNKKPY